MKKSSRIGFWLGIIGFIVLLLLPAFTDTPIMISRMFACAFIMAVWWITEALPLSVTALLPVILFPLFGIESGKATSALYFNHIIVLFIGGFLIATAMERTNLHQRIALRIISVIGHSPNRLLFGFMLTTAFLSMWISNTSTTVMMLAIALTIIKEKEKLFGAESVHVFSMTLLLGIAYSASIGGMSTLVGTPPNLSFVRIFEITHPTLTPPSFAEWMMLVVPISVTILLSCWILLLLYSRHHTHNIHFQAETIKAEIQKLGKMTSSERIVLLVFCATVALWIFRGDLQFGFATLPGWSSLLPYPTYIDDGTIAITMAMLLFFIPFRQNNAESGDTIINFDSLKNLHWPVIVLFGGGFALAHGFKTSGLSEYISRAFVPLVALPEWGVVTLMCTLMSMLTELTSNVATTEMILPIIAASADTLNMSPYLLMIPVTLCASCAFMLPVATPPNAMIYATGRVHAREMLKLGACLNVVALVVIVLFMVWRV